MKQVKFNLYVDNQKIRTLEQLKEHFNIDDVLEWYEQGVLQKWLKVRNFEEQLLKVIAIDTKDTLEIAKKMIQIFDFTEEQSKRAMDSLNYRLNYAVQNESNINNSEDTIKKYIARYEEIKTVLLERVE